MNFPNSKREKKPIRMPIVKKNYRLERAQYAFVPKIKIFS